MPSKCLKWNLTLKMVSSINATPERYFIVRKHVVLFAACRGRSTRIIMERKYYNMDWIK